MPAEPVKPVSHASRSLEGGAYSSMYSSDLGTRYAASPRRWSSLCSACSRLDCSVTLIDETPDERCAGAPSWPDGDTLQARRLGQVADQVRVLHGLTCSALAEVVDDRERDHEVPRGV